VIQAPPRNPVKHSGSNAGRKQRNKDKDRSTYPREGLPISRAGRDRDWIEAYQSAYYQTAGGGENLGDNPTVTISVQADRDLLDLANSKGINRSEALELGLWLLIHPPK